MTELTIEVVQSIVGELELTRRMQALRIAELERELAEARGETPPAPEAPPPG